MRTPTTGQAVPLPLWFLLAACELRGNDTTQTNRDFVRVLALTCNLQASSLAWLVLFSLMVESFPEFLQRGRKGRLGWKTVFKIADISRDAKGKGSFSIKSGIPNLGT